MNVIGAISSPARAGLTCRYGKNVLVATWNVRAFGDLNETWRAPHAAKPPLDLESLRCIKEIVSRFDVVAIQEVKGNIKALRHLLKALGPSWSFILTDVVKSTAGNYERLAFVLRWRVRGSRLDALDMA